MTKLPIASLAMVLFSSTLSNAEPARVFEIDGERKSIGSWSLVLQKDAAVMVSTGVSTSRSYPDTLDRRGEASGLMMVCNSGTIQFSAILPGGETLQAGGHNGIFGNYILWVEDQLISKIQILSKDVQTDGTNLIVPIFSIGQWKEDISFMLDASTVTVRASNMNLQMVTATYETIGTREAFMHLHDACGWSQ